MDGASYPACSPSMALGPGLPMAGMTVCEFHEVDHADSTHHRCFEAPQARDVPDRDGNRVGLRRNVQCHFPDCRPAVVDELEQWGGRGLAVRRCGSGFLYHKRMSLDCV